MKKLTALLLALILTLSLSAALATEAQYANTKEMLKILDDSEVAYTIVGIDEDGDECVQVNNKDENGLTYAIICYFSEDNNTVILRIYNILTYDPADAAGVFEAVNTLNSQYKFVSWYADTEDNTITLRMDLIVREGASAGQIAVEGLIRMVQILQGGYATIQPFAR